MRLFKPTYTKNGERRLSPNWHLQFTDHSSMRRSLKATSDKAASAALGVKVDKLVALAAAGERPGPELARWIERQMPCAWRPKLTTWGILDGRAAAVMQPLTEHIADYRAASEAKGNTAKHVQLVAFRVQSVLDGCGFTFWTDIDATKVAAHLKRLRDGGDDEPGISRQTSNYHLGAAKAFCAWMVVSGRASESPVRHLKAINARMDRRRERCALKPDEMRRLHKAAEQGPERGGVSGPGRALLYRVAVETGLRVSELRSLKRWSLDLDGDEPTVTVEAAHSKHRREDIVPIRPELAAALREHLSAKHPGAVALAVPRRTAEVLKADLDAARAAWFKEAGDVDELAERKRSDFLAYCDHAGRVADFHALRHTFITNLARAGVHPKTAQSLARHGSITLTMDRYSHSLRDDERAALAKLPSLGDGDRPQTARATGTDGSGPVSACAPLARTVAEGGRAWPMMANRNRDSGIKNAGPVAELADAADLKSAEGQPSWGFESLRAHLVGR